MLEDVYLPEPLYQAWPWLCLAISGGFFFLGHLFPALPLAGYAAGILYCRGMYQ